MKRFLSLALISLLALASSNCLTGREYVEPPEYKPEDHCDEKYMEFREDIADWQWVKRGDVRKMEKALRDCGAYSHGVALKAIGAAKNNRPDTIGERFQTFSQGFGVGAFVFWILTLL